MREMLKHHHASPFEAIRPHLAAATIGAVLATAGVAAAAGGEPRKEIVPALQAKVQAINVRLRDLPGRGWLREPVPSTAPRPRCSYYAPDQSDLTQHAIA